jgi:hypothetical protein
VGYRIVSTKLTEEEHGRLLDVCNMIGCRPSVMIKEAILRMVNSEQKITETRFNIPQTSVRESSAQFHQTRDQPQYSEFARLIGIEDNQQKQYATRITRRWTQEALSR